MTSRDALAVIGAISLFRFAWVALTGAIARVRAARAASALVGHWSPDMDPLTAGWLNYRPAATFHPAADDQGVITRRLPRGWAPNGRVIDVQMEVQ